MNDPYALPNGVLRNKLGITDPLVLAQAEADITNARLLSLARRLLPGAYDLLHLQGFHSVVFGDLYDWAGQLRTVNIAKQTPFCPAVNLRTFATEIFDRLRSADHLRGLERSEFVRRAAELYGDLNALHPFREGNGRTQRAFLGQLSAEAGWSISWAVLDPEENRAASVKSALGDNQPMQLLFDRLTSH
jgi:cell filamentation protein